MAGSLLKAVGTETLSNQRSPHQLRKKENSANSASSGLAEAPARTSGFGPLGVRSVGRCSPRALGSALLRSPLGCVKGTVCLSELQELA